MPLEFYIPPAGVSAVSDYPDVPPASAERPPGILADDVDVKTGEILSLFRGQDPVDAAIAHQFRIRHRAGELTAEQGSRFHEITHNDENAATAATQEARRIMAPFVERGDAAIERIVVEAGESFGDQGAVLVEYTNLRNGRRGQQVRSR